MEYKVFYLILSIFLFFPLLVLKRKHFGGLSDVNYFNLSFIYFLMLCFVGAFLAVFGGANESYFIKDILYKNDLILYGSLFVLWSGIGMFYTFIILLLSLDPNANLSWNNIFKTKFEDNSNEIIVISIFSIFSIFSFIYYQLKIYPSPFILALQGDALGAALKRIEITKNLSLYANTYIISLGNLIAQLIAIQLTLRSKTNNYEKFLKYTMIFLSFLYLISNGEKATIVFYFFSLIMAYSIVKKKFLKINLKLVFYFLTMIIIIYWIFVSNDFHEIKNLIFERVFFAQMAIVYFSLDYYNSSNYIGFSSIPGFINKILDVDIVSPSSEVLMSVYFNEMIENGGWNINGVYISEAWSNYGWFGVLLGPIYVGFILCVLYVFLTKFNNSFSRSLLIYYTCCSFSFVTSLNLYIYNSITILVILLILIRFVFFGFLKR